MSLRNFHTEVMDVVNESALVETLVWSATRRAVNWLEQKHSFHYMKGTDFFQFGAIPQNTSVSSVIQSVGATDVTIDNPVVGDSRVRVSCIFSPFWTELNVGDYVRFDTNAAHFSASYNPLAGEYGQVAEVNVGTIGGNVVIAVPSDAGLGVAIEVQPITFTIQKLKGNPFATADTHPGLLPVGKRLKSIDGKVLICAAADLKQVIREVGRIGSFQADVNDMSWDASRGGDVPAGYKLLGRASKVDRRLLGSSALDQDDYLLLFWPVPNDAYWVSFDSFRYSDWPVPIDVEGSGVLSIDGDYEHFLLEQGQNILLARTIIELGPAIRDPEMVQGYMGIIQNDWQTLMAADVELQESDGSEGMSYDANYHSRG